MIEFKRNSLTKSAIRLRIEEECVDLFITACMPLLWSTRIFFVVKSLLTNHIVEVSELITEKHKHSRFLQILYRCAPRTPICISYILKSNRTKTVSQSYVRICILWASEISNGK